MTEQPPSLIKGSDREVLESALKNISEGETELEILLKKMEEFSHDDVRRLWVYARLSQALKATELEEEVWKSRVIGQEALRLLSGLEEVNPRSVALARINFLLDEVHEYVSQDHDFASAQKYIREIKALELEHKVMPPYLTGRLYAASVLTLMETGESEVLESLIAEIDYAQVLPGMVFNVKHKVLKVQATTPEEVEAVIQEAEEYWEGKGGYDSPFAQRYEARFQMALLKAERVMKFVDKTSSNYEIARNAFIGNEGMKEPELVAQIWLREASFLAAQEKKTGEEGSLIQASKKAFDQARRLHQEQTKIPFHQGEVEIEYYTAFPECLKEELNAKEKVLKAWRVFEESTGIHLFKFFTSDKAKQTSIGEGMVDESFGSQLARKLIGVIVELYGKEGDTFLDVFRGAGKDFYQKYILEVKKESRAIVKGSNEYRDVAAWVENQYGLSFEGVVNKRSLVNYSDSFQEMINDSWGSMSVGQRGFVLDSREGLSASTQTLFFPLAPGQGLLFQNHKRPLPSHEIKLINSVIIGDDDLISETLGSLLEDPNPQTRVLESSEIRALLSQITAASREIYGISLGVSPIPDAEKMVITFSHDVEFEWDENGKIVGLKKGEIIGTVALADLRYDTTPFIFTGFAQDKSETGEEALAQLGVSMDDCMECGTLATHPFSRIKVIKQTLLVSSQEILDQGKTHGVMVTHRAMEKVFTALGIEFQIIAPDHEFRENPKDKERIQKWCAEKLRLEGDDFELWWERYINNKALTVQPYLIKAESVINALS